VKLKQVLTNLLENAAQYTQNGAITVTVGRAAAEGGDEIVFSVADSGAGIEPARLPLLLNSFETLDDDDHRSNGGAGLGLALANKFCELIAGKLSVESEVGRGSIFTLTLPANVNAPSAAANDESLAQSLEKATEGLNAVASAMRNAGRKDIKDIKGSLAHAKAAAG
jgi:signal transduction histidine kinase